MRIAPRSGAWASVIIVGGAVVALFAPTPSAFVERYYSRGFYAFVQPKLTWLSSLVPFELQDVLLVVAVATVLVWLVLAVVRPRRHALRFFPRVATLAATLYLVFLAVWGLNYRRVPLREAMKFDSTRVTQTALRALAARAVAEMNAIHPRLPATWPSDADVRAQLAPAFRRAAELAGAHGNVVLPSPKRSILSPLMAGSAISGFIAPFFLEVTLDPELLPFERPGVLAHEWAHVAGRGNESEASFVGWLACMHGPPIARYSGWMRVFDLAMISLPVADSRALDSALAEGPRRDRRDRLARWMRNVKPRLARTTSKLNDRMLKANRVSEGTYSYTLAIELILGIPTEIPPLR